VCGNGVTDPGEDCDDHNTNGGDGCSALCTAEVCGNGVLDPGEQCDDGNTLAQDGCASDCTIEHCPILISHQGAWVGGQLAIEPGTAKGEQLAFKANLGIPGTAPVDVTAAGMTLLFADTKGAVTFSAILPGGG